MGITAGVGLVKLGNHLAGQCRSRRWPLDPRSHLPAGHGQEMSFGQRWIASFRKNNSAQLNRSLTGIAEGSLDAHPVAVGHTTEIGLWSASARTEPPVTAKCRSSSGPWAITLL